MGILDKMLSNYEEIKETYCQDYNIAEIAIGIYEHEDDLDDPTYGKVGPLIHTLTSLQLDAVMKAELGFYFAYAMFDKKAFFAFCQNNGIKPDQAAKAQWFGSNANLSASDVLKRLGRDEKDALICCKKCGHTFQEHLAVNVKNQATEIHTLWCPSCVWDAITADNIFSKNGQYIEF